MNAVQGTVDYHKGERPDERYSFAPKLACVLGITNLQVSQNRTVATCKKVSTAFEVHALIIQRRVAYLARRTN